MNIYSQLPIQGVLAKVLKGVRLLRLGDGEEERGATAGAISQRRYQLGWLVMRKLFNRVCQPLATPQTKGGFLFGLRLMAMDGTKEDVLLAECGTHAIVDAEQGRCYASERGMGMKLLRSITAGLFSFVAFFSTSPLRFFPLVVTASTLALSNALSCASNVNAVPIVLSLNPLAHSATLSSLSKRYWVMTTMVSRSN